MRSCHSADGRMPCVARCSASPPAKELGIVFVATCSGGPTPGDSHEPRPRSLLAAMASIGSSSGAPHDTLIHSQHLTRTSSTVLLACIIMMSTSTTHRYGGRPPDEKESARAAGCVRYQDARVQGAELAHAIPADAVTMHSSRWLKRYGISSQRDPLRIVAICA